MAAHATGNLRAGKKLRFCGDMYFFIQADKFRHIIFNEMLSSENLRILEREPSIMRGRSVISLTKKEML